MELTGCMYSTGISHTKHLRRSFVSTGETGSKTKLVHRQTLAHTKHFDVVCCRLISSNQSPLYGTFPAGQLLLVQK